MDEAKIVNAGVDTLVLNVFYTNEQGKPVKRDLDESLWRQLDEWKRAAQETHEECPTSLVFHGAVLHMAPNGVGQGQWPWMLKTKDITLYVSGGHWNGIASVRFSSQYLWSCPGVLDAMVSVQLFLDELFKDEMYLQVSSVDLCVDVAGWDDVDQLDRASNFIARSRKRGVHEESGWSGDLKSRDYALGLQRTGFDFSRDSKASSALSCRIYDKSREIEKSGKDWFIDLWRTHGWLEEDLPDGWLRCVLPSGDKNRSRWPTHPVWHLVQGACLDPMETPPQFGKIVRRRWEEHNIDKGIEAVVGYLSSLAAWAGEELAEDGADLSVVLHWLAMKGEAYLERVQRDFSAEVQRKRLKFGLQAL